MDCKVEWCSIEPTIKGFCNKHYNQDLKHGRCFKTGFDKREPIVEKDYARLPLTKGKYAVIDIKDIELVTPYQWYFDGKYAATNLPEGRGKLRLHRLLINPETGLVTDHINGDRLDNKRNNLRMCSSSANNQNRPNNNKNGYRGITWNKRRKKWVAQISIDNKNKGLGYFITKEEAAEAYNAVASKLHGEFARLNHV